MTDSMAGWRRWLRVDVWLVFVALATGVAGAWLSARYLLARGAEAEASVARRYQMRSVVVAAADVARGELLDAANLAVREFPDEYLPADAVAADRAGILIGGRAAIDMSRGSPVALAAMQKQDPASRLSGTLAISERALTVAVDELSSLAGGLRAGDHVDLYFARRDGNEAVLAPLLQQVEILATGDSIESGSAPGYEPRRFATITLRLSPEAVQRVLLAQQVGDLSIVLRSRDDEELLPATIRSSRELLRQSAVVAAASRDIELLTGGGGAEAPARTWLKIGTGTRGANP